MTITDFCAETKNWFDKERVFGVFKITDGTLHISSLQDGQYFRIIGSIFNDGVYKYPANNLKDETFDGAIWAMAIPKEVIDIVEKISAWEVKYKDILESPYSSESFGGYTYMKSVRGTQSGEENLTSWQSQFKADLNRWRKI